MRSMYGPGRILLASKKPHIKKLITDCENLSIDEIKRLSEKPDIIKGLIEIKELGRGKGTNAELIANAMQRLHRNEEEKSSMIYQYLGMPFWIKDKATELQIETFWYWLQLGQNTIYISSNILKMSTDLLIKLQAESNEITSGFINDVRLLEKDRVSKLL